jgi:hypothetical protein
MIIINGATSVGGSLYRVAVGPYIPAQDYSVGGFTVVAKFQPTALAAAGAGVRLVLRGPATTGHTCALSNVTISLAANTSGSDLYDSSASPTAVTFNSSASLTMVRDGTYYSDNIAFTIDRTRAILIAFNVASGTQWLPFKVGLSSQYFTHYWRAATAEAATTNRTTGYSAGGGAIPALGELECYS